MMKTGRVFSMSYFGAVMICDDCGAVVQLDTSDIRKLIDEFKATSWAGLDLSAGSRRLTVFICPGCAVEWEKVKATEERRGFAVVAGGKVQ